MNNCKTNINELDNGENIVSHYWEGYCPHCAERVKIHAPPHFINHKAAFDEIEARYNILKEYVYEYSVWLEKQVGYYPEDQYLQECLISMIDRFSKLYPSINFNKFKDR